eukprot:CAMPEP_0206062232 /NCGR_PEP_ID=MMETSP1466-20131121/56442_1 /ASSEMBLY_ACC=CAM_ASM_001126 /TAXON_ID=44452 /ORGANISM="Pavlova gyrans, Strain CCMP608" /LENGTH=186 /DNA_ID=CAMNT_0053437591 /DNA_START=54 /DNA_END=615 /DNA_ORIENTATION=+
MFRAFLLATLVAAASAFSSPLAASRMVSARAVVTKPSCIVMSDIEEKVKGIIAEQLGVDAAKVTPDASFTEDLGADSLDAVELIMAMEEAFGIEIPDEEAEKLTTPKQCVDLITSNNKQATCVCALAAARAAWPRMTDQPRNRRAACSVEAVDNGPGRDAGARPSAARRRRRGAAAPSVSIDSTCA